MAKVLGKRFFDRPVLKVAPELVGRYLVRKTRGKICHFLITEVEAYDGFKDLASHASRGKTARNAPMFGEAGRFYVYLVYGNHWMLNIVTGKEGYPAAVLIRGLRGISGPGRLTKALTIGKKLNGKTASKRSGLWFEEGRELEKVKVKRTPRIGVRYAGLIWAEKKYRFLLT